MSYRTVLFDVDGTLVDSNDAHAEAWVQTLAAFEYRVPFERVRPLIGMGADKLLPETIGVDAGSDLGTRITTRRRQLFLDQFAPKLRPTRGAQRLLEWLRDEGKQLVVATSAHDDELETLLRVAGASKLFDAAGTSGSGTPTKPDPDVIETALANAGVKPVDAIMIGDTPYDIQAALRAGVGTIALRCGGYWNDDQLAHAVAIYDDPEDLLNRYALSPFKRPLPADVDPV